MDHELARTLKKAGFPQHNHRGEAYDASCWSGRCIPALCFPALSELIEACGSAFDQLERSAAKKHPVGQWCAWTRKIDGPMPKGFWGSTPEEAVARLWLALYANGASA
jgi:hypothetical protein